MAFKLNRPFSLGRFVKLRINKKSVGLQVGGKYLKGTINTKGQVTGSVGGAGTGMYIQKTKNLRTANKCQAITKSGNRCSRNSNSRSDYCSQHNKYNPQTNSNLENDSKVHRIPNSLANLYTNKIFDLAPNQPEIDRIANLFHTTNNSLEKLHNSQDLISFQKHILLYYNFIVQDFIRSLENHQISAIAKKNQSDTEHLSKTASEILTRLINSSFVVAQLISPIKFPSKSKRLFFGGNFPFEYSLLDYLDLNKIISENDFVDSVIHILENFNNWNDKHNFDENMWNDELEEELKIFSEPDQIRLPNSLTGIFDISDEGLTWLKGFDLETFLKIYARCFYSANFQEIKKTSSYNLMKKVFNDYNFDLEKLLIEEIDNTKTAKNAGNFRTSAEVF